MRLEILDRVFTRGTLKSELRRIRDSYQPGEFIADQEQLGFFNECLRQGNIANARSIEANVRWFIALHENLSHDSKCFGILRDDNTVDYPSLDRLAGKKKRQPTIAEAARGAILGQVNLFRASKCGPAGVMTCDCGCGFTSNEQNLFHVDHADPPFSEILAWFISEFGLIESQLELIKNEPGSGLPIVEFADPAIAGAWLGYHYKHAKLQLLRKECHAPRTRQQVQDRAQQRRELRQ
jgi:hypothetical protein